MAWLLAAAAVGVAVLGLLAWRESASPPPRPDLERVLSRRAAPAGARPVEAPAEPARPVETWPHASADEPVPPDGVDPRATDPAPAERDVGPAPPRLGPVVPPAGRRPEVAIVIDDLGRSVAVLERLAGIGVPLTYAVLPFETQTAEVVSWLRSRGAEVLCHLPMEPAGGHDPGPGALYRSMSAGELVAATRAALDRVPVAVGANNHMGSGFSAAEPAMRAVLGVLAERGLYYIDSRTTPATVGLQVAASLGLRAAERQVFLDNVRDDAHIRVRFDQLLAAAVERGSAVAIAHPYPETLRVLAEEAAAARARGFVFVTAGAVARAGSASASGGAGE